MGRLRIRVAFAGALVLLAATGAQAQSVGTSWAGGLAGVPQEAQARVDALQDVVRGLRASSLSDDLSTVVQGLGVATGNSVRTAPRAHARDLSEAVASIAAASEQASSLVREAFANVDDRSFDNALRATTSSPQPGALHLARDASASLEAAALIAATIDAALPALRVAASRGVAMGQAEPCDVLDQRPNLCVGGTGANRYESDVAVLIDLGGDDVYRNRPGLGSVLSTFPVGVALDLSGNDTYESKTHADDPGVQGAGAAGVGLLADLGGNDVYRVTGTRLAAGQGRGVLGGVGLLYDAGGKDRYEAAAVNDGMAASMQGQGHGALGGVGALVDAGGDDTYLATATVVPVTETFGDGTQETYTNSASVAGQGMGVLGGAGVLMDGGGNDAFTLEARLAPTTSHRAPVTTTATEFVSSADGQGAGVIGAFGALLTGEGSTTYAMHAASGPLRTQLRRPGTDVFGQGAASVGSTAVLDDAGGKDRYEAVARALGASDLTVEDNCDPCDEVSEATAADVQAQAQGQGLDASVGLLVDGSGDDVYRVDTASLTDASARDARSAPASAQSVAIAASGSVVQWVQAIGLGPGGLGVILDRAGDDRYEATAESKATATTSATLPENRPMGQALPGAVTLDAQGVGAGRDGGLGTGPGTGLLADLGGTDQYRATGAAAGDADGEVVQGTPELHVQAAVDLRGGPGALGLAFDVDGGASDTYLQVPATAACLGVRGTGVWRDCAPVAVGVNS